MHKNDLHNHRACPWAQLTSSIQKTQKKRFEHVWADTTISFLCRHKNKTQDTIFSMKGQIIFFIWMHNHRTQETIFSMETHNTIFSIIKHNHITQYTIFSYGRTHHNFNSIQSQSQNTRDNFFLLLIMMPTTTCHRPEGKKKQLSNSMNDGTIEKITLELVLPPLL
jgi:hypothetical protein